MGSYSIRSHFLSPNFNLALSELLFIILAIVVYLTCSLLAA